MRIRKIVLRRSESKSWKEVTFPLTSVNTLGSDPDNIRTEIVMDMARIIPLGLTPRTRERYT